MEYVPALKGFLVVTATEDADNVFHGNTLWFVADDTTGVARKIEVFGVAMKAEGLAVLGASTGAGQNVRQAPHHLRQRPARDQEPQPLPDRDARSRDALIT